MSIFYKQFLLFLLVVFLLHKGSAQSVSGKWKGYFTDNYYGSRDTIPIGFDILSDGKNVKGVSSTFLNHNGTSCTIRCNLSGSLKKQNLFIRETGILANCFSGEFIAELQTYRLKLEVNDNTHQYLRGTWINNSIPNNSNQFIPPGAGSGKVLLKKIL